MKKALSGFALSVTALALTPAAAGAATITVTETLDKSAPAASCTLREAVTAADNNADSGSCDTGVEVTNLPYGSGTTADTIVLTSGGAYGITGPPNYSNEDLNVDGDIDIGAPGDGGPLVIRSNNPAVRRNIGMGGIGPGGMDGIVDRMFHLSNGEDLTLESISAGTSETIPADNGGVIKADTGNDLTLTNVELSAASGADPINAVDGGVIYFDGNAGDQLTITDSLIRDGDVTSQGGGIYSDTPEPTVITRSIIRFSNAITMTNGDNVEGGGIWASGPLTLTDSEVTDNRADSLGTTSNRAAGGGINAFGIFTITRSLIAGNRVTSDGAPGMGAEENGAGLFDGAVGMPSTIVNTTIQGNIAGNDSVMAEPSFGGGIYRSGLNTLNLNHVTFQGNNSIGTGDVGDQIHNDGANINYTASIIPGGGGVNVCEGGNFTSLGYNVLGADDMGNCEDDGPNDTTVGLLGIAGAPANNGGPIVGGSGGSVLRTVSISPGSNAQDRVTVNCPALAGGVDQRGLARPQGAACDSGAYEICTTAGGAFPECPLLPPVVVTPTPTPIAALPTTPAKKKCKKGRKLKKGKCVKKKKKKK